ncbi:hypothetical protein HYFRA_00013398 [Hymenoscyphus fraxineus]|uniref:Carboxylesterase type B domain-containing protein n=1 Tax=Hymenoscyphus fraxineus TaxID=746836 RepID=A0A9N9PYP2_9HELO|nr:hypothetical protein HYFRA_00013398 [Hymenoscyphus fraxineus]
MVLHHPTLGPLIGRHIPSTQTTQYRNLKFATIPSRFSDPILFSPPLPPPTEPYDATNFGPSCPQHPSCFKYDLSIVGNSPELEKERERRISEEGAGVEDELECANLIVVVPGELQMKKEELFPVMGSWWWLFRWKQFLATIRYRLGPFGFLASSELEVKGNYGLKDQACAFEWIKNHISGFGGDPNIITAFGESAGSISLTTHLHTQPSTPLFNRLIALSGDPTLRRPNTLAQQTKYATQILTKHDISTTNNVNILLDIPAKELVLKLPPYGAWAPTIDGSYIKDEITVQKIADHSSRRGKPEWCERVLIGDALGDATVLHDRLLYLPSERLLSRLWKCLARTFPPDETPNWTELTTKIMRAYQLPLDEKEAAGKGRKEIYAGMLALVSDLRFHCPSVAMQKGWGERVERYVWGVTNPHPNSLFTGYASHELEVAFLLQNFPFPSPSPPTSLTYLQIGKQFAAAFINFAYGHNSSSIPVHSPNSASESSPVSRRIGAVKEHLVPPSPSRATEKHDEEEIIFASSEQGVTRISAKTWDQVCNHGREDLWSRVSEEKWYLLGDLMQNSAY